MPVLPDFKLTNSSAHAKLRALASEHAHVHMRDLFASETDRVNRLCFSLEGLYADFSKHRIDERVMNALLDLAREGQVKEAMKAMVGGAHINATEDRAVLHTALRSKQPLTVDKQNIRADVDEVLARMKDFVARVRNGVHLGHTQRPIDTIVNIGIGGSDLGPAMVVHALRSMATLRAHFVSNVDGADLEEVLNLVNPETTLFIVVSKTFTTQETLANAQAARSWLIERLGTNEAVNRHFIAVSTNLNAVETFGISADNVFGFWDWVGGRYSLWSAVGISIALTCGWEAFDQLLEGAQNADEHALNTPFEKNIPVVMALLGIWYRNYMGSPSHAVIPYSHDLRRFPAYLQQADMESNGKSVGRDGQPVNWETGPLVWGEPGTNGQHAFFQLLHQGTDTVPVDFIAFVRPLSQFKDHHSKLLANCFAQAEALMNGKDLAQVMADMRAMGVSETNIERLAPYRVFAGNRPSTVLLFDALTPKCLGMLIALYEHKIFVQGVLWNLYSFDQWGVELGKELAARVLPAIEGNAPHKFDPSTAALINYLIISTRQL